MVNPSQPRLAAREANHILAPRARLLSQAFGMRDLPAQTTKPEDTMFKKSLLAAAAALTFAFAAAPAAQARGLDLHFHEKLVCKWVQHGMHFHQVCKVVIVPHLVIGGGHHHHHHHGHHHHDR
jgi:hypothetical protein